MKEADVLQHEDALEYLDPWVILATGTLVLRYYQNFLRKICYISLLIYITMQGWLPSDIYNNIFVELIRDWRKPWDRIGPHGTHWTLDVANYILLWAYSVVITHMFPGHTWKVSIGAILFYNVMLQHNVTYIWTQTVIACIVRIDAEIWDWRSFAIDIFVFRCLERFRWSGSLALCCNVQQVIYWLFTFVFSERGNNVLTGILILRICAPSNVAVARLQFWAGCVMICRFCFWRWAKCLTPCPPKHIYKQLKAPDHIRVVLLYPRFGFGPICCSLIQGSHMRGLHYEAISYTWNNVIPTTEILIDGQKKLVTRSVHEILTTYSSLFLPKLLWIDALCINQEDDIEKSKQVPLMAQIYQNAIFTTVFLGQSHLDAHRSTTDVSPFPNRYNSLRHARTELQSTYNDASLAIDLLKEFYVLPQSTYGSREMEAYRTFERLKLSNAKRRQWAALLNMILHPWFKRCWILQEVALSSTVYVRYGSEVIDWTQLAAGIQTLEHVSRFRSWLEVEHGVRMTHFDDTHLGNIGAIHALRCEDRFTGYDFRKSTLGELLEGSTHFHATNPRDLIYSFTSMCSKPIRVDYTLPVATVFLDAAKQLIREKNFGLIFHAAGLGHNSRDDSTAMSLPSWVPDLTKRPKYRQLRNRDRFFRSDRHIGDATKVTEAHSLIAKAVGLDSVENIGPILFDLDGDVGTTSVEDFKCFMAAYVSCLVTLKDRFGCISDCVYTTPNAPFTKGPSGQSILQAFHRTLFLNSEYDYGRFNLDPLAAAVTGAEPAFTSTDFLDTPLPAMSANETYKIIANANELIGTIRSFCGGRRLFISKGGYIGLCPPFTKKDDQIYLVPGVHVPLLLRPHGDHTSPLQTKKFKHVGESYIHHRGIMQGAALTKESIYEDLEIV